MKEGFERKLTVKCVCIEGMVHGWRWAGGVVFPTVPSKEGSGPGEAV